MKARTVILLVIVALLLASSVAWAQSGGRPGYGGVGGAGEGNAFAYPAGGHYRLTSITWQVRGVISGGGYRLAGPLGPNGTGAPCCCSYLPCVMRNF